MKKRKIDILILLIYSVPYVFLGMLGDITLHNVLPYLLMAGAMVALLGYCMKTQRMLFAALGNLMSLLSSGIFTRAFATENWNVYFKAYSPVIRTLWFSLIMVVLQGVIWWFVRAWQKENEKEAPREDEKEDAS